MPVNTSGLTLEMRTRLLAALDEAGKAGIRYNVTSGHRSAEKQTALWNNRANNPFPVAPPGSSLHEHGQAVDIALADEKQRRKFTDIFERHGFNWGGNFKRYDPVHYEYRPGGVRGPRKKQPTKPDPFIAATTAAKPDPFVAAVAKPDPFIAAAAAPSRKPDPFIAAVTKPDPFVAATSQAPLPGGRISLDAQPAAPLLPGGRISLDGSAPPAQGFDPNMAENLVRSLPPIQGMERTVIESEVPVGRLLVRSQASLYALRNITNSLAREHVKLMPKKRKGGVKFSEGLQANIRGLMNSHPWQQFRDALMDAKPGDTGEMGSILYTDPEVKKAFDRLGIDPKVVDFLLEIPVDAISGRIQGLGAAGVQRFVGAPLGRAAVKGIGKLGRAADARPNQNFVTRGLAYAGREIEGRPAYRGPMEISNRAAARNEAVVRETADVAEETRRVSQGYLKKGVKIRTEEPITKRIVNKFDQWIADWLEAGAAGSRHEALSGGGVQVGRRRVKQLLARATKAVPKRVQALRTAERVELDTARAATEALDEYKTLRGTQATSPRLAPQVAKNARAVKLSGGALGRSREIERNIIAQGRVASQVVQTAEKQLARLTTRAGSLRGRAQRLVEIAKPRRAELQAAKAEVPAMRQSRDAAIQSHLQARKQAVDLQKEVSPAIQRARRAKPEDRPAATRAARARVEQAKNARSQENRLREEALKRTRELAQAEGRVKTAKAKSAEPALDRADKQALAAEATVDAQRSKVAALQKTRSGVVDQLSKARSNTERTRVDIEAARQRAIHTAKAAAKAKKARVRAASRFDTAVERQSAASVVRSLPVTKALQKLRRGVEHKAIRAEAEAAGVKWEDVERLGQRWQKIADAQGKRMVELGLLNKETFERLRGVYLPRLYLLRSVNPREAEELLRKLERAGHIGPEEARAVRQMLDAPSARGVNDITPKTFDETRELETFMERDLAGLGRKVEGSATVAMTGFAKTSSKAIADAEGIAEIVSNPSFAMKKELSQAGTPAPKDWTKEVVSNGETYLLHPQTAKYLEFRNNPSSVDKLIRSWEKNAAGRAVVAGNNVVRKAWVTTTQMFTNNAIGNAWVAHSAAAINNVGSTRFWRSYNAAADALKLWNKSRKVTNPLMREIVDQTDLLSEGSMMIPKEARRAGSGFGVERTRDRLKQVPGKAAEALGDWAFRGPEQSAKIALYMSLRHGGKSVQEAARIVRAVLIDYKDVGPARRLVEQSNALPFITWPTKTAFQLLNQGARRPDLLHTYSGERLRTHLDLEADAEAVRQNREPVAQKKRARGQLGLYDFPLPGVYDDTEQPVSVRAPMLAPAAALFGQQQGGDSPDVAGGDIPGVLRKWGEDRLQSALPLARIPLTALTNHRYNPFSREYEKVVEPGSIPEGGTTTGPLAGRNEVWLEHARSFASTIFPQARDADRIIRSFQGTTGPFGGQKQPPLAAITQSLFGIRMDGRIGENDLEKKLRKGKELGDPREMMKDPLMREWQARSTARGRMITESFQRREPAPVVDQAMRDRALRIQDANTADQYRKAATERLDRAMKGQYTGSDKGEAMRRLVDWIYELTARGMELQGADIRQLQPNALPTGIQEAVRGMFPAPGASPP